METPRPPRFFFREHRNLFLVSVISFLLIYLSSFVKGYGYFIDEFYYIACAAHPAFGYVDHPPLAPFVLTLIQSLFGTSLWVLRIIPAAAVAVSAFLTGILAKEIGGGKVAQLLAACSWATAPMAAAFGGIYSMNAFEPLLAIALLYYAIRMVSENDTKKWIAIGILMGLGVMNKHTFAVFIVVFILSLILAGKWRLILNRWFLAGSVCGLIIILPNLVWQVVHAFPSLEFYRNISTIKNMYTPPAAFVGGQLLGMSPANVPIWIAGTFFLLVSRNTKEFRFLAFLFVGLFFFMMLSGTSRSDRMVFAYPPVLAGGALFVEHVIRRFNARWLSGVLIVLLISGLALGLPIILPYFDYDTVRSYTTLIGYNTEIEKGKKPPLPQLLADRIGWEGKFDLVLHAYQGLSSEEQQETIISAGNYGQAGAIELFGKPYQLPPVVCGHNTYYLWSRERLHGNIVLALTQRANVSRLRDLFESVEPADGEFSSSFVSFHENNLKVFICRSPRFTPTELLEKAKFYY